MCWRGEGRGAGMRQMHPTANSPLNARLVRPALKLLRACDGVSLLPKEAHSPEAMESIKLSAQRVVHLTKLHAKRGGGMGAVGAHGGGDRAHPFKTLACSGRQRWAARVFTP